jgi:hypothetical protein
VTRPTFWQAANSALLLVAIALLVAILVVTSNAARDAASADYRACMLVSGVGTGGVTDVDAMVDAAEECSSS